MRTFLIAFAIAFFFGIGLTWLIRNLAIRWKLYDQPEGRKIHNQPIPRLGGIAVATAFFVPILALTLSAHIQDQPQIIVHCCVNALLKK